MSASIESRRKWRRAPISSLAHAIRMESVRQANIYPTCRLDKSNRALYEPEDVWAKRADLAKIDSRSNVSGKTKGLLKQRIIAMSTTRVTKENMEAVDRVKETVAVLMSNKERAADIGAVERRILQPRVACAMDRMSSEKRVEFEGRVQSAVERMVYAAKRRFVRRQEKLDEAGVFHPEANAHRVHTQFWADLQNKVNVTKIENAVWAKMCEEAQDVKTGGDAPKALPIRVTNPAPHDIDEATRSSSAHQQQHRKARPRQSRSSPDRGDQEQRLRDEGDSDTTAKHAPVSDDNNSIPAAQSTDSFAGVPGYDEVGHVPTLEEFRQEWPRPASRALKSQQQLDHVGGGGAGSWKGGRRALGQGSSTTGAVVQDLSKKDEVFRHFKKYYDRSNVVGASESGVMGTLSLSAAGSATGILRPDMGVIETVGRHTAEMEEVRRQNRVGEGILSTLASEGGQKRSVGGAKGTVMPGSRGGDENDERNSEGLTNVFRLSADAREDATRRAAQHTVNAFSCSSKGDDEEEVATAESLGAFQAANKEQEGRDSRSSERAAKRRGQSSLGVRDSTTESSRPTTKGSLEGSSIAAELQASLEASWAALHVTARHKLEFLQRYSTLERALDLPRTAQLLEIASKAIPLKEKSASHSAHFGNTANVFVARDPPVDRYSIFIAKVADLIHRVEEHGEPMCAESAFSTADEDALYDLDCWANFNNLRQNTPQGVISNEGTNDGGDTLKNEQAEKEGYWIEIPRNGRRSHEGVTHTGDDGNNDNMCRGRDTARRYSQNERNRLKEGASRRQNAASVLAWLRLIERKLTEKCAEASDLAWYEVGETITYQGRSVALGLPQEIVEVAARKREEREGVNRRRRRVG